MFSQTGISFPQLPDIEMHPDGGDDLMKRVNVTLLPFALWGADVEMSQCSGSN